jgi:hypothetical protein
MAKTAKPAMKAAMTAKKPMPMARVVGKEAIGDMLKKKGGKK